MQLAVLNQLGQPPDLLLGAPGQLFAEGSSDLASMGQQHLACRPVGSSVCLLCCGVRSLRAQVPQHGAVLLHQWLDHARHLHKS